MDDIHKEFLGLINDIKSVADDANERLVDTFKKTLDKYQEQPELLEPYLADLLDKLTDKLQDANKQDNSTQQYHTTFKFLYQIIKVVGFKSIGRKLPHQTDTLPFLVDLLAKEDPEDKLNWHTRYVLVTWLSTVVLTPFDLAKFDGSSSGQTMSDRIYSTLLKSLNNHDSCQHVTAYCLARYFSRPDMLKEDKNLQQFTRSALDELANIKTLASSTDDIKLIGHLRTLAYLFKFASRDELKKRSGPILDALGKLDIEKINRELINHLIIKLLQRVGVALLPKRVAGWRYKRGSRILGAQAHPSVSGQPLAKPASEHLEQDDAKPEDNNDNMEEEEVHSAQFLESILSVLFVAAQNAQTKIRWSAAKGIARLASRLSRERASDVIDTILANYFDPATSSEYAWHGGCLSLAEMSRQGLILEEKLPAVTEVVGRAIIYDKIKGSFSVGTHVRESACYVFWAMSRTYEDQLLAPYIQDISINLLCTMLFDREVQCRRAASATFQELVGRQGTYNLEGISILNKVDYQSVGIRQFAYMELATQVAQFGAKYYEPFIHHLIEKKLGHWDIQIRRLASDSLSALMLYPSHEFVSLNVLPQISEMIEQNVDNNCKHGAILGLAKAIRSLVPLGFQFKQDLIDLVGSMALKCDKQLKSKQQAPNFIEAISALILSSEVAQFNYSEEVLKQWEVLILQALDSDNTDLRNNGSDALLSLYRYFYKQNKSAQDRLLTYMNKALQSPNESSRCGALKSLSKLGLALSDSLANLQQVPISISTDKQQPSLVVFKQTGGEIKVDSDTPDIVLMSLTSYIGKDTREKSSDLVFAQAKAEACEALANFIKTLDKSRLIISGQWLRVGLDALLDKTEDYTFDKRGDIGVVVRRAAVRALQDLTLFLTSIGMNSVLLEDDLQQAPGQYHHSSRLSRIISKILQQAVSYNNSAREQAAMAFYRLIRMGLQYDLASSIPHHEEILLLFDKFGVNQDGQDGETFNWRDDSTPIFVNLLSKPEYSQDLWVGLLPAVGQASDLCAKQFRDALSNYLQSVDDDKTRELVLESFMGTLERPELNARLVNNGLIVADYLLTQGLLISNSEELYGRLERLCWASRGQGDPKRLVLVGQVMCSMIQLGGQVQRDSLEKCLALLINGYAKVRVITAEQLYVSLDTYEEDLVENLKAHLKETKGEQTSNAPNLESAKELLSETNWSEPLEKVKPVQEKICILLAM